jgi:hypothetical protein
MSSSTLVLESTNWEPSSIRYMQPRVNDRGGKSISIISTQSNRSLHVSTPLLMTWGISDYVNDQGESDGKFSMSLVFPNEDYSTVASRDFLDRLKKFENQILDDAVKYSEVWFGEEMSREVAKHTFFPFLKYSKDKLTKKVDYSRPPTLRAKVPCYNNKWSVEVYDTQGERLFPCENENMSPLDFVPKKSNVACVLQCGGLWFGGKGWGITWKLNQCVVKPSEIQSVFGKCHIQLSSEDIKSMSAPLVTADDASDDEKPIEQPVKVETAVEDSDEEEPEPEPEPKPEPVKKKVVKKKTVKKAAV